MGAMAASDHQGRREGEGLGAKGRRGRFLVQVRPPGAQHLDVGLGSARAVGAVHGEKDPSPGSVPLVKVPGEVVQAPMKGLGHPGVAAAFHVIKHLERQGPLPHFPGMAANLTENNLTFTGWQINGAGTVYTQGQTFSMGSANVTLEAKWTANPTYTVTYSGNGSMGGTVPVDTTNYEQSQNVTVLGNIGNLTETNFTFTGWQINGAGTVYTQGQTFSMGSANVTLEAKWTPVASSWTGIKQLGVAGLCGRLGDCGPRRRCGQ
jgi:uncharacterized repeat protein (TIGR02543 family)